jgi:hypothetical protein
MTNKTTDFQRDMFYDIYKTTLGAILSRNEFAFGSGKEQAVLDAVKIANVSVELLTDNDGLKEPSIIMGDIDNEWETIKKSLE